MNRLGLIGVGRWGRRYIETAAQRSDCRFVAFARQGRSTDVVLSDAIQCDSWLDVLDRARNGDLDGVVVATNPENQAEVAAAALRAGVPSLIEKPLGLRAGPIEVLCHTASELVRPPPLLVNHVHLWSPAYLALRGLVREGQRGGSTLLTVESEGCGRGPFRHWSSLFDYGPHDVALCLDLLGVDAPFSLRVARRRAGVEPPGELFEASFLSGSATVSLRVGNGAAAKCRRLAVGLAGGRRLVYDDLLPHPNKLEDSGRPVPVDPTRPLDRVLDDFFEQIASWRAGGLPRERATRSLVLSSRVMALLESIAAAATFG